MKLLAIVWLSCTLITCAFIIHEWREIDRLWIECSTDQECYELHGHEMFAEAHHAAP
jgi:hypothetical protein